MASRGFLFCEIFRLGYSRRLPLSVLPAAVKPRAPHLLGCLVLELSLSWACGRQPAPPRYGGWASYRSSRSEQSGHRWRRLSRTPLWPCPVEDRAPARVRWRFQSERLGAAIRLAEKCPSQEYQATPKSTSHSFGSTRRAQLTHDRADMEVYGVFGNMQAVGLLFIQTSQAENAVTTLRVSDGTTKKLWVTEDVFTSSMWIGSLSVAADGKTSAAVRSSFRQPPEVWGGPLASWTQLTHVNAGIVPEWGDSTSVQWKSDSFAVQGWLVFPRHYDKSRTYPMVVDVHGARLQSRPQPRQSIFSTRFCYPARDTSSCSQTPEAALVKALHTPERT